MIDKVNLESYLDSRINKKFFLTNEIQYTADDLDYLKQLYSKYKNHLWDTYKKVSETPVKCAIKCNDCLEEITLTETVTSLKRYIMGEERVCRKCKKARTDKNQQKSNELKERNVVAKEENTRMFIQDILSSKNKWTSNATPYKHYEILCNFYDGTNVTEIIEYIKNMPYQAFLNSLYWRTISRYARYKAGWKCKICNDDKDLHTHHRTYERHGEEIYRDVILNDLIVLCNSCHSTYHAKGKLK